MIIDICIKTDPACYAFSIIYAGSILREKERGGGAGLTTYLSFISIVLTTVSSISLYQAHNSNVFV